ncbi:uncharacterized protein LOC104890512 [Beta vulgaris subsp. vulgaris]|uniref:uncharacterized protein LOC104890512 n=1 Tax=Beta vulgaris subsp. vulgaris TaxID=3555 RepID=UPI0020376066|nr:uncharacterized protein LOC104890512 [Beta vulgaris subsp. vulgaris]XP_010674329.2 uncharacterized protein LOC104890512 [Beta vulgaris subsp. vulgaris]
MSRRQAKTSGWTAFDQQQRQQNNRRARSIDEPFPSLPSTVQPANSFSKNKHGQVKSFSSVILPSLDFSAPLQDDMKSKPSAAGSSKGPQISAVSQDKEFDMVFRQLKELFGWADDSLIEDIMAATGSDFDQASSFLKAMVPDQRSEELKVDEVGDYSCDSIEPSDNGKLMHERKDVSWKEISEPAKMCSVLEPLVGNNNNNGIDKFTLSAENLFNNCAQINAMLSQLTSVPVEPEWEEDDVYLSCRKEAIKKMRAATRHSKAATNSFLRGDHISAQQFSLEAREEWKAAQSLNAKAACEILSIRNEKNGIWILDLHGLHASEAVQAVKERLYMIEAQVLSHKQSKQPRPLEFPNSFRTKAEVWCDRYSDKCNKLEQSDEQASHKLKPVCLEVITGIGNHSRGGAALPTAVKTFLADNGYWFDEARPGVIMVRPKFRPS